MSKEESIAKYCHEANRLYCLAIGDDSQVPWKDSPDWLKISTIKGVKYVIENRDVEPADSHNAWLNERMSAGWAYGEVKDVAKKKHPNMVEYNKLPSIQKNKDIIFIGSIHEVFGIDSKYIKLKDIIFDKLVRVYLDTALQIIKSLSNSRKRSLSITKVQEGIMWLGMDLKDLINLILILIVIMLIVIILIIL